jgi:uncharacterized RDD family membrane protein YckC
MVDDDTPRPREASDFPPRGPNSLASFAERGVARFIDILIPTLPVVIVVMVLIARQPTPDVAKLPTWPRGLLIGLVLAYETVCVGWRGRTVGKVLFGTRVARLLKGTRPDWGQAFMRALVPVAALSVPWELGPGLYVCVFLSATFSPIRRGLHDQAAGTVVVRTR